MDILLAGGTGRLIDAMINKFRKEGHHVYVLTGSRYKKGSYSKVFEKYYFEYNSDVLHQIFESVNPDVTIFLGAYDTNFLWNDNTEKEAMRYQTAVINLLLSFSHMKKGRFIYLSSQEVFSGNYDADISEDEKVTPATNKAMAIAQGEQICLNYVDNFGKDIVILRAEHIYNTPTSRQEVRDRLSRMCLAAIQQEELTLQVDEQFSMIHESDVVEFVFRMAVTAVHNEKIYHLSSSEPVNYHLLREMISKEIGDFVSIDIIKENVKNRKILSKKRYESEFGMSLFHHVEDTMKEDIRVMKKDPDAFLKKGEKKQSFFKKLTGKIGETLKVTLPFIENMIVFIPIFMLNNRAVGSDYFQNLDFYLLYVLLFAVVYGQQQAVFSGVLAVIGYCFREMYDRTGFDVMLDYNTYVWIAQLFILGMVVGFMKDQLRAIKGEDEQEMDYLKGLLGDIEDINDSNVKLKNVFESQVVNQNDSFGRLYEVVSDLEQYSPEEVLFYAAEVVGKIINSDDVAIYNVSNRSYARLFAATSPTARVFGNSVDYTKLGVLYDTLVKRKVYINKEMDERYPLMANAIYSEDEMQIIIMVWGIPWERMTLGQANTLTVVSYLIQNAVVRANRYLEALEDRRYMEGSNILEADAFGGFVEAFSKARNRGLTECAFISVEYGDMTMKEAGEIISKKLRQTDLVGKLSDGKLYIILANSNIESANFVIGRLIEAGLDCKIREELEV